MICAGISANGLFAFIQKSVQCACGRLVYFVVNRDGKTRCVACDLEYEKEKTAL